MKKIYLIIFLFLILNILCFSNDISDELLKKAYNYEKSGDIKKALVYYDQYLKNNNDEKILLKTARITTDYKEGIKRYKKFINNYPVSRFRFLARYELAMLFFLNEDYDNALNEFTELSEISKGSLYWQKSFIYISIIEYEKEKFNKAMTTLYELLEQAENYEIIGNAYYLLGKIMIHQGLFDDAENFLLICAGSFPQSTKAPASLLELITLYLKSGKYLQAERIAQMLNQLYPDSFENVEAAKLIEKNKNKINKNDKKKFLEIELISINKDYDINHKTIKRMEDDLKLSLRIRQIENVEDNSKTYENDSKFYVQIGYLTKEENAENMVNNYIKKGIKDVFYSKTNSSNSDSIGYRVVIGPFKTKEKANEKLIELKEKNVESIVLELYKSYE